MAIGNAVNSKSPGVQYLQNSGVFTAVDGSANTILLSGGSNTAPSFSTSTYPSTNAINTLLYASSANIMAALPTANSSILVTSSGGVPSLSGTLPFTVPVTTGGTGLATLTAHAIQVGNGTSAITQLAVGATGTVLTGVTGADPAFSATPTLTSVTFGSGSALSVYAVNSFTPTVVGGTIAGTTTYVTQTGYYIKIGNLVYFEAFVQWSNATGTGLIVLQNLPFTVSGSTTFVPVGSIYTNVAIATSTTYQCLLQGSSTQGIIYGFISATGVLVGSNIAINTANFISVSGCYSV